LFALGIDFTAQIHPRQTNENRVLTAKIHGLTLPLLGAVSLARHRADITNFAGHTKPRKAVIIAIAETAKSPANIFDFLDVAGFSINVCWGIWICIILFIRIRVDNIYPSGSSIIR
jgi:hypothetical protein